MVSIIGMIWILSLVAISLLIGVFMLFSWLSWNINVTVLRFTGNKQRPMVMHKKARKRMVNGVPFLSVKGYKTILRDFKSEFYWPSARGKYGALILWEFEDGWLTPVVPKKEKLTPEQAKQAAKATEFFQALQSVNFEYDAKIHHRLKLKVIDDVDMEFFVEQLARQEKQYTGGLWAFLDRYGTHIVWIFMATCALVGFILYMKNAPNLSAQCLSQLGEVVKEDFLQKAANSIRPGG